MNRLTNKKTISPRKQLFLITWPILIESLLQTFMRFSDTFMLSFISDEAVAAIGVVNQIMMFTFVLFNFTAMGSGVVVSQYVGAKNPKGILKTIVHALMVNLLFGAFISVVVVSFRPQSLNLFDLEPALYDYANTYMLYVGAALFAQAMVLTVSSILQAMGHTKDVMVVVMLMNVSNVFLNYVFIFVSIVFSLLGVLCFELLSASVRVLGKIGRASCRERG